MKQYTLNKIQNNNQKYFTIELGLLPGYKKGTEYTILDVINIYEDWLKDRINNNLMAIPAKVTPTKFIYGFKSTEIIINSENAVSIQGEVIRKYCPEIFDDNEKVLKIIIALAEKLGKGLKQERIHITFHSQKYILE